MPEKTEEWISQNEYMRRYNLGHTTVKQMIYNKELEAIKTPGGQYKIKVGKNAISKEMYDNVLERAVRAETKLQLLQNILLEGSTK